MHTYCIIIRIIHNTSDFSSYYRTLVDTAGISLDGMATARSAAIDHAADSSVYIFGMFEPVAALFSDLLCTSLWCNVNACSHASPVTQLLRSIDSSRCGTGWFEVINCYSCTLWRVGTGVRVRVGNRCTSYTVRTCTGPVPSHELTLGSHSVSMCRTHTM